MTTQTRDRSWCLTINNYKPSDVDWDLTDLPIDYLILGKEIGKETNTPHLQGFLYSKNKITLKQLKKIFPTAHLEVKSKKSSYADAISYCMKDLDYIEFGDRPRQGKRTDLELIKFDLKNNVPMTQISDKYFSQWCQYRRAFDEYSKLHKTKTTIVVVIIRDDYKTWKFASEYMRGSYIVLDHNNLSDLYKNYFSKQYDYIITPKSAYTTDIEKKYLIVI